MIITCKFDIYNNKFVVENNFDYEQNYVIEELINDRMNDQNVTNIHPDFRVRFLKNFHGIFKFDVTHRVFKDDLIEVFKDEERKLRELEELAEKQIKKYRKRCNELESRKKLTKMKEIGFDNMTNEEFEEFEKLLKVFEAESFKIYEEVLTYKKDLNAAKIEVSLNHRDFIGF